jgi:hypothetical protein
MNTEQMNEAEENVSIDLEESGSVEIEQTSVPEQLSENEQSTSEGGGDELENYSDNVKKRINQLTAKRKQAVEEAEAAVQYAQQVQQQNQQMKQRIAEMDQGYVTEYSSRVDSQFEQAKKLLKEARDMGEIDKEIEAQELLSRLSIEKERVRMSKSRVEQPVQQVQQPQQRQAPPQQQQSLDPKLVSWMGKNDNWFNKDMVMTRGAQAIHEELVASEGFDPTSDDYYSEIDKRMRKEFPHKFQSQRQNAQSVAPASSGRSIKSGRKKSVELTPGQVAFARKMNIPLERYAKEVAKLDSRS